MKVALLGVYGLLAFLVLGAGRDLSAQAGSALASTTRVDSPLASWSLVVFTGSCRQNASAFPHGTRGNEWCRR